MDGRRRPFVALHLDTLKQGKVGWGLRRKFGNHGIAVWAAALVAAKESDLEGTITYESDEDLWSKLGVDPPPFTAKEFFDVTGDMKWTRRGRKRVGYVTIVMTKWEETQYPRSGVRARTKATGTTTPVDAESDRSPTPPSRKPSSEGLNTHTEPEPEPNRTGTEPEPSVFVASAGIAIAIEEARQDPDTDNPDRLGEWRYRQRPGYYDALAVKTKSSDERRQPRPTEAEEQDALDAKKKETKRLLANVAEAWSVPEADDG